MDGVTYFIKAKSVDGQILIFGHVKSYEIVDGLIVFRDAKTGKVKRFAISNVEISEESQ